MTPRPCRGGARGGVSVFISTQLPPYSFISFIYITDPTPIPSPTGAGKYLWAQCSSSMFFQSLRFMKAPLRVERKVQCSKIKVQCFFLSGWNMSANATATMSA